MGLYDFFVKDLETKDLHEKQNLRTHYYKCEYNVAKEAVLRFCKEKQYTVQNIDDKYGEIFIQTPSFHIIVSIRRASVVNMSIDVKVSVYYFIAAGRPAKIVGEVYKYCDKQLPFIGIGLQSHM